MSQGNYFSDTESGLDWLDVRETQGLSFLEVDVLLSEGGALEGWRRATREEFNELMTNIGMPFAPGGGGCAPNYCEADYGSGVEVPEIDTAISLLGDTYDAYLDTLPAYDLIEVPSGYTFGMLAARTSSRIDTAMIRDGDLINASGEPFQQTGVEDLVFTDCAPTGTNGSCQDGVNAGSDGVDVFRQFNYPKLGTFLVRDTPVVPVEICDNGIDDDQDGLIDGDDPDCVEPVGLRVQCLHSPIYPQEGEQVSITAVAFDGEGTNINADSIEIVQGTVGNVVASTASQQGAQYAFVPQNRFTYGCRAELGDEATVSWPDTQLLKYVDVGTPEQAIVDEYSAVPIGINGSVKQALDIVLIHEKDQYTGFNDPVFIQTVTDLVNEGIFQIPWFIENQAYFNIWLATADDAEAQPRDTPSDFCKKKRPSKFKKRYGYADAAGIIHKSGIFSCRAKAELTVFTVESDADRLQIIAHELGHALFYLSDEYCGSTTAGGKCKGFRFTTIYNSTSGFVPPFPNLYPGEGFCRNESIQDGYDPDACRNLNAAQITPEFWLREPDYRVGPRVDQVRDLMQQSGGFNDAIGDVDHRYGVNASERKRMDWIISNCKAGGC